MITEGQPAIGKIGLPPEQFAAAFPFHLALDLELNFLQVGSTLRRISRDIHVGGRLDQFFRPVRPEGQISLEWIKKFHDRVFLLEHKTSGILLRGGFMFLPDRDALLFLGSPWFTEESDMSALGLKFEDFAVHDPVSDMIRVIQANKLAMADLEKYAAKLSVQGRELQSANERLRQQEAEQKKLALIAARTDNAVVLTDSQGRVEWVNEGFVRLTGYTLEEVAGKKPGSVLQGPDTDPETVRYMHDQLAKGEGFQAEIVNYTKAGRKYWLSSEAQPIRDANGRVTNFMAIQIEITGRKNAEGLLLKTSALQRAMLEGAGYAIIATDQRGVIQLFNSAAERMLGYAAAEMIGRQTPTAFHDPEEVARRARELSIELGREVKPGFEAFVAKAEFGQPDQREWTYLRKDGARFPVLLSVTALFDDQKTITGYLGVASELAERKRDEEKIRATLSELERMNRVMMNREQRVLELKGEINQMCLAAGLPPAYPAAMESGETKITTT